MRHLGSIVLSIVFAAVSYVLAGYGIVKFVTGTASGDTDWTYISLGIAALVVAGVLYAVLVMTRISPLGPLIAGALYVAAELWYALDQSSLVKTLGTSVINVHGAQEAPLSGLALFAAIPLLATIVSPRRWRGKEAVPASAAPTYGAAPAYPGAPGSSATTSEPVSAAPLYAPTQTTPETAPDASSATPSENVGESRDPARGDGSEKQ